MTAFLEKWFNRYNDYRGSGYPFRVTAPHVRLSYAFCLWHTLVITLLALLLGGLTAVVTVLARYAGSWYPLLASGRQSLLQIAATGAAYALRRYGTFVLIDMPLLACGLMLLSSCPRYYFWNRRADRLSREPPAAAAPALDSRVWPPPIAKGGE